MTSKRIGQVLMAICLGAALSAPLFSQAASPPARPGEPALRAGPASPLGQESASAETRKEVVKVNYIEVQEAFQILNAYKSVRGRIQMQRNRNTLIIEDSPDFVDKLLSILKEIDVPPLDIMFTVDVILGTTGEEEAGERIPDSDPVLRELKSLLRYDTFTRLDSTLVKVLDNGRSAQRMGGAGIGLLLELYPRHVKESGRDAFQVVLNLRQTTKRLVREEDDGSVEYIAVPLEKTLTLLETQLTLVDGERSAVGVSKLNGGDTAIILIIQGKVIR